jgi:hypothetical protein
LPFNQILTCKLQRSDGCREFRRAEGNTRQAGFAYNPENRSGLIGGTSDGTEGGFAVEPRVIFPG